MKILVCGDLYGSSIDAERAKGLVFGLEKLSGVQLKFYHSPDIAKANDGEAWDCDCQDFSAAAQWCDVVIVSSQLARAHQYVVPDRRSIYLFNPVSSFSEHSAIEEIKSGIFDEIWVERCNEYMTTRFSNMVCVPHYADYLGPYVSQKTGKLDVVRRFYVVGNWGAEMQPQNLLPAFMLEWHHNKEVRLCFAVNRCSRATVLGLASSIAKSMKISQGVLNNIEVVPTALSPKALEQVHDINDCYISISTSVARDYYEYQALLSGNVVLEPRRQCEVFVSSIDDQVYDTDYCPVIDPEADLGNGAPSLWLRADILDLYNKIRFLVNDEASALVEDKPKELCCASCLDPGWDDLCDALRID